MNCRFGDAPWDFVLGALGEADAEAFREHLLDGCGACGSGLEQARRVIAELDLAMARQSGEWHSDGRAAGRRRRLLERIAERCPSSPGRDPSSALPGVFPTAVPGVFLVPAGELGWVPGPVPGVEVKRLVLDPARSSATMLVRMAPGASYPAHRHVGREECYVLAGDVSFGVHTLGPGDFQVAEPGSVHPVQSTERGCLVLLVACTEDEVVE